MIKLGRNHPLLTNEMIRDVPPGSFLSLGDAGDLHVLGHINVATSTSSNTWYGDDGSHSSLSLPERGVALVVERRRPGARAPRTLRCFLDKLDGVVPAEFYQCELVHLDVKGDKCYG